MVSLALIRSQVGKTPVGTFMAAGMASTPTGYLPCDGAAVSRTTYAALFASIGTSFGAGDGSTTFNVPNTSGLFLRGSGSQVVSSKTFDGGAIGNKQKDLTAVNGLSAATVSTPTLSLANTDLTHTHAYNDLTTSFTITSVATGASEGSFVAYSGSNPTEADTTGSALGNHAHTVTPSITSIVTNVSASGTESKPASLSAAYFIKY